MNENTTPVNWRPPLVVLIGMGMSPEDLSPRAHRWLEQAEILAGGHRHLAAFSEYGVEKIVIEAPLDKGLERIRDISARKRTAVLASGDPFYFGIGKRLVETLGDENVLALPNVTSVQTFFARLRQSWEDVKVISLHGRKEEELIAKLVFETARCPRIAVFTDNEHNPAWIARQLLGAGFKDRILIVAENLGEISEKISRLTVEEALEQNFAPLNMAVILSPSTADSHSAKNLDLPLFGLAESAFLHEAGMITKMEVRAVVLACLHLIPDLTLWDLGAGSGAVGIEAARLVPLRQVFAVEMNDRRYQEILVNAGRLAGPVVKAIKGRASEIIGQLPTPDRVFIGGSGPELQEILESVAKRLAPRGRVVQTTVTLDSLEISRSFWQKRGFELSISQVQINRSVPVARTLRFEALNPVFVISAWHTY